jgi:hypothetical protein
MDFRTAAKDQSYLNELLMRSKDAAYITISVMMKDLSSPDKKKG